MIGFAWRRFKALVAAIMLTKMSKPSFFSPLPLSSSVWIDTVKRGP